MLLLLLPQVSDAVVRVIEELEPTRQAIFEAQTAFGQARWNEHLAVDLRLAGEDHAVVCHTAYVFQGLGGDEGWGWGSGSGSPALVGSMPWCVF